MGLKKVGIIFDFYLGLSHINYYDLNIYNVHINVFAHGTVTNEDDDHGAGPN